MSYVVINAITVPSAHADELAARFAGRAGMVESADGFEHFELLRPAVGRAEQLEVLETVGRLDHAGAPGEPGRELVGVR